MYKKFYIAKSLINILLVGLMCFFMFFDEFNYVISIMILLIILTVVFKIVSKSKFEKEEVKEKNNIPLNVLMILSLWAGVYFSRIFIAVAWILYVFTEILNYNEARDYFD